MYHLRENLGIALLVQGIYRRWAWLEQMGLRVMPAGPDPRCAVCHGQGWTHEGPCTCGW